MSGNVDIKNKKATFEYHILERFEAGMQLNGPEIKSIRGGKASIVEAYCYVSNSEVFIKGMHVAPYDPGSYNNADPIRERKLLLKKSEISRIEKKLKDQGITLIPLRVYLSESGYAKVEIALAQGKKLYDKRESLKEKDAKRAIERARED